MKLVEELLAPDVITMYADGDFPPVSPIMRMRNIKASYTSLCLKLLRTEEMLLRQ